MPAKNKLVIKHGFLATESSQVTGSLIVSAGVTGSLLGTASNATLAADSDRLGNVGAASYALNTSITGFATTSSLSSYALATSTTGFATTGSNTFSGTQVFNGNVTINGTGSITYLNAVYETASIIYSSGSNQFGDATSDVQTLIGTVITSGALQLTGSLNGQSSATSYVIEGNGFGQLYISNTGGPIVLNPGSGGVGMAGVNQYITAGYFVGQTAGTSLTGSFSGSFKGDGAGLTGVTATAIFPTTATTNLASSNQFYVNDGANKYVTYGDLLTDLAGSNLSVEGTDSLALNTTVAGLTSVTSTTLSGSYVNASTYVSIGGGLHKIFTGYGDFNLGANDVITVDSAGYGHAAIHVKYVLYNKTGTAFTDMRAGTLMVVRNASQANIAEATTQDIGNTLAIDFTVAIVGTSTIITMDTTDYSETVTLRYEYTLL